MSLDIVDTLCQLVSLPSVNPMGRAVSGDIYFEGRVTDYLQSLFQRLNLPWQRQHVEEGRENILTRVAGDPSRILLLEVHQDTVPVEGMTIEPFVGQVRDGRVWGRGSCDIKGGMAAMLGAVARLAQERPTGMPTVVLACTVNEEYGQGGATALTELWQPGASEFFPQPPDAAIVAEPTLLNVVVAHKGIVRWRCHAHGRAAHSSQPQLGDNAIYKMSHVVQAVERYHNTVLPTMAPHRLCGRPSICASTIVGGISVNAVPDICTIELDRRLLPDEDPQAAYNDVVRYIAEQTGGQGIEHELPYRDLVGLSDQSNGPFADRLVAIARRTHPESAKIGVPYGTDATQISRCGVPTIVFGPGSIDQAHTADEWLAVSQLKEASELYYRFALEALTPE